MPASGKKAGSAKARRFAVATAMVALLPFAAYAQQADPYANQPGVRSDAQKKTDVDIDKAYQQAVKGTRDKAPATKADPWGTIRPAASDNTKK